MKWVFFAVCYNSVSGVVAAVVADDIIGFFGQDVDYFAFTFVAPL